jgi:hypothetical protein
MATAELRELRHRYKVAYTSYLSCVQALSDASQNGIRPSAEVVGKEEKAFEELKFMRQALLDALHAHVMKSSRQNPVQTERRAPNPEVS